MENVMFRIRKIFELIKYMNTGYSERNNNQIILNIDGENFKLSLEKLKDNGEITKELIDKHIGENGCEISDRNKIFKYYDVLRDKENKAYEEYVKAKNSYREGMNSRAYYDRLYEADHKHEAIERIKIEYKKFFDLD